MPIEASNRDMDIDMLGIESRTIGGEIPKKLEKMLIQRSTVKRKKITTVRPICYIRLHTLYSRFLVDISLWSQSIVSIHHRQRKSVSGQVLEAVQDRKSVV